MCIEKTNVYASKDELATLLQVYDRNHPRVKQAIQDVQKAERDLIKWGIAEAKKRGAVLPFNPGHFSTRAALIQYLLRF